MLSLVIYELFVLIRQASWQYHIMLKIASPDRQMTKYLKCVFDLLIFDKVSTASVHAENKKKKINSNLN